jgi:hypothetical protein
MGMTSGMWRNVALVRTGDSEERLQGRMDQRALNISSS